MKEVVPETTNSKKKKQPLERTETEIYTSLEPESKTVIAYSEPKITVPEQTKKAVEKNTKKVIRKIGSYKESNVLSSGKINVLRDSLNISGNKNNEYTNLARYMANKGLSNASSAYFQLTNARKELKQKTYALSVESSSNKDILEAAIKITGKISTSKYGVGISSTTASVGYKIYIVVVYS